MDTSRQAQPSCPPPPTPGLPGSGPDWILDANSRVPSTCTQREQTGCTPRPGTLCGTLLISAEGWMLARASPASPRAGCSEPHYTGSEDNASAIFSTKTLIFPFFMVIWYDCIFFSSFQSFYLILAKVLRKNCLYFLSPISPHNFP